MITVLFGEDNFLARRRLGRILHEWFSKESIERYDGESMTPESLADTLQGASLFSFNKLVVIRDASKNKIIWSELALYIEALPSEVHLVLFEEKLDKRTKTYKLLHKFATLHEEKLFSESEAVQWLYQEAKQQSVDLSIRQAEMVIDRVGVDTWQLHYALEKLANLDEISNEDIAKIIEAQPRSNVFTLIDVALAGKSDAIHELVEDCRHTQDPYQFFGLLSSQLFQLMCLSISHKSAQEVAKDLSVHPYPLQKMSHAASKLELDDLHKISKLLRDCDNALKRSGVEPWYLIEQALMKLSLHKSL